MARWERERLTEGPRLAQTLTPANSSVASATSGYVVMVPGSSSQLLPALSALLGSKGMTTDPQNMTPWLEDWRGRYRGAAAALLSPASRDEVAGVVRLCAENRVPIVPQGGNTSMVGGATPDASGQAMILSLRRMRAIRIDADANRAVCEAGTILSDLHEAAAGVGRRFPLSLAAKGSATIGGLVSTNAGGTQVLRFGTMRALVQGVEAVLPDGSIFDGLAPLRKDNRGYSLTQLLIGAEGTLGIVTAASLSLVPAIASRSVAWIGLAAANDALRLLRHLETALGDRLEAFELIPQSAVELVLRHVPGTRAPLATHYPWQALIEIVAPEGEPAPDEQVQAVLAAALEGGMATDAAVAASEAQAQDFWRVRESIAEAEKKDGPAAKHDISVAVEDMPRFLDEASAAVLARFPGTRINAFGHLGDGNIHFNVRAPRGAAAGWVEDEGRSVNAFVHDLVTAAGGSISAEHGIGQMKLAELERLGGAARLTAMRAIKQALDPHNIMNPGKLVETAATAPGRQ